MSKVTYLTENIVYSKWFRFNKNPESKDSAQEEDTSVRPSTPIQIERSIPELGSHRPHQLCEIREVSETSKAATMKRPSYLLLDGISDVSNYEPEVKALPNNENESDNVSSTHAAPAHGRTKTLSTTNKRGSYAASTLSLPLHDIPQRFSSMTAVGKANAKLRRASVQEFPSWKLPPPEAAGQTIHPRGRARSPVRQSIDRAGQSSEALCSSPARTFIRSTPPTNILDHPLNQHDRLRLDVRLPSPLFIGGGTIEGQVGVDVDGASNRSTRLKPLLISTLAIDVLGVEEISDGRRCIFLCLASELIDGTHPPPPALVRSQKTVKGSELYWVTKPSKVVVPFCVNLPLNIGPPSHFSKHASIRYVLCATMVIKVGGTRHTVRELCSIQMLTAHNPEKALAPLANPLVSSDTTLPAQGQTVKLTAGLHRQIWVNGSILFVDIHLLNASSRVLKKVELRLEKTTLCYSHAAAGTAGESANHLRIADRVECEIVSSTSLKKGKQWKGVLPQTSEARTCDLEVPRGQVTISCGRYFEIRYFVHIIVSVTTFKNVHVKLPVTIIHINSLDIMPNALAQVAASIEAKRSRTAPGLFDQSSRSTYRAGQAFSAARAQSTDHVEGREKTVSPILQSLTQEFDGSPRQWRKTAHLSLDRGSAIDFGYVGAADTRGHTRGVPSSSHHHHVRHPSCYHCHLLDEGSSERPWTSSSQAGPRLPRLPVSTSGLGFSESEFEVPPDSPLKKVMLSELERKMIQQQRELNLQRQWNRTHNQTSSKYDKENGGDSRGAPGGFVGWNNVAVMPRSKSRQFNHVHRSSTSARRPSNTVKGTSTRPMSVTASNTRRNRSKTNPEAHRGSFQINRLPEPLPPSATGAPNFRKHRRGDITSGQGRRTSKSVSSNGEDIVFDRPHAGNIRTADSIATFGL